MLDKFKKEAEEYRKNRNQKPKQNINSSLINLHPQ